MRIKGLFGLFFAVTKLGHRRVVWPADKGEWLERSCQTAHSCPPKLDNAMGLKLIDTVLGIKQVERFLSF